MSNKNENFGKEKRLHPRVAMEITVKYRVLGMQKEIESILERREKEKRSMTKDASLGGLYITTREALKVGSVIQLDILIPSSQETIKTYAEVAWASELGCGLKFIVMPEDGGNRLRSLLEDLPPS